MDGVTVTFAVFISLLGLIHPAVSFSASIKDVTLHNYSKLKHVSVCTANHAKWGLKCHLVPGTHRL